MSVENNRFEQSDIKTRKKHQIVLTVNSPALDSKEMEFFVSEVVHTVPSEKAFEAKAKRLKAKEMVADEKVTIVLEKAPYEEKMPEMAIAPVEEAPLFDEEPVAEEEEAIEDEPIVKAEPVAEEAPVIEKTPVREPVYQAAPVTINSAPVTEEYEEMPLKGKRRFKLSLTQKKALSGWIFVLPFIIGIIFIYAPIIYDSIAISLSDVKLSPGGMELTWNGFGNYSYLFSENGDPYFSITIVDGIKDLILQIPAIVIFALFMAIILNQKMTGRAAFRAIFFLPVILSTGIIDSIDSNSRFMEAINNSQGGVDDNTGAAESGGIISALDLEGLLGGIKIGTELVDYVVSLVNGIFDIVSRSGVQMLIFLSGLQSISPSIYESCEVEGASAWETFWKITLPMISPMILVNAIYTVIDAFTAADNRVMIYIEKIYNQSGPGYARSSAMSWVYIGVVLLFIVLVALIMKTVVFYQKRD